MVIKFPNATETEYSFFGFKYIIDIVCGEAFKKMRM